MGLTYKNTIMLFMCIVLVTLLGFQKTYLAQFPNFEGLKTVHHLHGLTMVLWLVMLFIQPLLIKFGYYAAHRALGKLSLPLVVSIIVLMALVYQNQYLSAKAMGLPIEKCLKILYIPFTDMIPFTVFYVLAILNRYNIFKHTRYIIGTGLVVLVAGFVRIFVMWFSLSFVKSSILTIISVSLFWIFLILNDKLKNKVPIKTNPFTISLMVFLIPNILYYYFPETSIGQALAQRFIDLF